MDSLQKDAAKPVAENFCMDFISEMKVPDYLAIKDPSFVVHDMWRAEWERGVQIPTEKPGSKQFCVTTSSSTNSHSRNKSRRRDFILPRSLLKTLNDNSASLQTTDTKPSCTFSSYDMDSLDYAWLQEVNRDVMVVKDDINFSISETFFETCLEWLETASRNAVAEFVGNNCNFGLGIEFDSEAQCSVCQSIETSSDNEILFCDGCDLAVHQGCYGVVDVPVGRWFCSLCLANLNSSPPCELCPLTGTRTAMKRVKGSATQWCHVVCCLWIPETCFQDPYRMDVVVNLENVCKIRKSLTCCLCKQKKGACVQCSNPTCATSYHVTCAMKAKFEVSAEYEDEENDTEVQFLTFCRRHTEENKKERSPATPEKPSIRSSSPRKTRNSRKSCGEEELVKTGAIVTPRKVKLERINSQFYTFVDRQNMYRQLKAPKLVLDIIYEYWKLKRKCANNEPLVELSPKSITSANNLNSRGGSTVKSNTLFLTSAYIDLRRDMEKLRNLAYMCFRREKLKKLVNSTNLETLSLELKVNELSAQAMSEKLQLKQTSVENHHVMEPHSNSDYVFYDKLYCPRKTFSRRTNVDENQNHTEPKSDHSKQPLDVAPNSDNAVCVVKQKRKLDERGSLNVPLEIQGKRLDLRDLVDKLLAASEYNDAPNENKQPKLVDASNIVSQQTQGSEINSASITTKTTVENVCMNNTELKPVSDRDSPEFSRQHRRNWRKRDHNLMAVENESSDEIKHNKIDMLEPSSQINASEGDSNVKEKTDLSLENSSSWVLDNKSKYTSVKTELFEPSATKTASSEDATTESRNNGMILRKFAESPRQMRSSVLNPRRKLTFNENKPSEKLKLRVEEDVTEGSREYSQKVAHGSVTDTTSNEEEPFRKLRLRSKVNVVSAAGPLDDLQNTQFKHLTNSVEKLPNRVEVKKIHPVINSFSKKTTDVNVPKIYPLRKLRSNILSETSRT